MSALQPCLLRWIESHVLEELEAFMRPYNQVKSAQKGVERPENQPRQVPRHGFRGGRATAQLPRDLSPLRDAGGRAFERLPGGADAFWAPSDPRNASKSTRNGRVSGGFASVFGRFRGPPEEHRGDLHLVGLGSTADLRRLLSGCAAEGPVRLLEVTSYEDSGLRWRFHDIFIHFSIVFPSFS